jgi:uncharacterized membrane protein YphA (DoxX/SURF4 family)
MSTQALAPPASASQTAPAWPLAQRLAFRFCVVYFTLFAIFSQIINAILIIPGVDVPDWATLPYLREPIIWVAKHIFRVKTELVYSGSGSGDKTFDWVLVFCVLIISLIATAVWSALDRRRPAYPTLKKWFWLFLRFVLASQMFTYGFAKAVPLQMSFPYLSTQIEPFGHFSPMGVLWSSIGALPAYEIFAGCAELLGGLLLIFPRTVTLGAFTCLMAMVEVFTLNMTYDVPVKLFSFHLILLSALLLVPQARRVANFFLLNRAAEPVPPAPLFASRRANRIALAAQAVLWLWMLGNNVYGAWSGWHTYGGGRPKSDFYGIWNVDECTIDGQPHPPLLTDKDRFRRVIFESPDFMAFQRMDDSNAYYNTKIDAQHKTMALSQSRDKNAKGSLAFGRPAPDRLALDGDLAGHKLHLQLHLDSANQPLFATRGFHWISEYPFNR